MTNTCATESYNRHTLIWEGNILDFNTQNSKKHVQENIKFKHIG